jgi:hypothetical protein
MLHAKEYITDKEIYAKIMVILLSSWHIMVKSVYGFLIYLKFPLLKIDF